MFGVMNEGIFYIIAGLVFYTVILWILFMEIYYKTVNDCYDSFYDEVEFYKNRLSTELSARDCNECDIEKYKELVINTQKKAEKNNKKIKAQKKGMKKLQKKYDKLRKENECLKRQLCEK